MLERPYRGDGTDRPAGIALPPARLPLFRGGRVRKQWRYVSIWSSDVSICAARIAAGPLQQEFWVLWDRTTRTMHDRSRRRPTVVELPSDGVRVRDGDTEIDIALDEDNGSVVEVITPVGRAYTWTRKQCVRAHGSVRVGDRTIAVEATALIDDNAGYYPRHTNWRWSAGAGRDNTGRTVAWNAIVGLNASPTNSERTVWIDGVPQEIGPVAFGEDLSFVAFNDGALLYFTEEAVYERQESYLLARSSYRQPFGTFSGTLPGGIEIADAVGVLGHHEAVW